MRCVRQQRQAVGQQAADDFGDQEGRREPECPPQRFSCLISLMP